MRSLLKLSSFWTAFSWVTLTLLAPCQAAREDQRSVETQACDGESRHVTLVLVGDWDTELASHVFRDLSGEMSLRKIDVCRPSPAALDALSEVRVSRFDKNTVRIEIVDTLTEKRVTRDLDLSATSGATSGLVIAVAIDELLQATWAELDMKRPAQSAPRALPKAPPPEVPATNRPQRADGRQQLGVGAVVDFFPSGSTFWGADLGYVIAPWERLRVGVNVGARFHESQVSTSEADDQRVTAQALRAGISCGVPLWTDKGWSVGPQASFSLSYAWFQGRSENEDQSGSHRDLVLSLRGGIFVRKLLGRMFLQAESEWGSPVLGLEVTDGTQRVGGLLGLESANRISLGAWWQ